jgi:IS30 family transposase
MAEGSYENINGLIRKYIPKSTTFERISQQQITKIMEKKLTIDQEQNSTFQHQKSAL